MMTPADAAISRFLGLIAVSLTTPEADGPPLPYLGSASDRSVKVRTASVMPSTHPAKNPKLVLFAFGDSSINTAAMMASGPTAMLTLKGRISPMTARIASIPFLHRAAVLVGEIGAAEVPSLKRPRTRLLEPSGRRITLRGRECRFGSWMPAPWPCKSGQRSPHGRLNKH